MRRRLVPILILPLLFAAAIAAPLTAPLAAGASVPVGAIEILSGPNATYGNSIKAGLELALDTINQKGVLGGQKIALAVEDSGGNKERAISAARKLIGADGAVAIIGPTLSSEMFAVGPIANGRAIPIIGTSTTAKGITDIGDYVFRTSLPEADVIPVTLAVAKQRGIKSVALLHADDDMFSVSGYQVMKAAAQQAGFSIVADESFGSRDTDFSAQLTKIKALKPDAIGISALVEPISGVLLQARQLGIPKTTLFIGGNGANSPKLGKIAGEAADGLIVGSPWALSKPEPDNQRFVQAFTGKVGHPPDQFAAQAYDTMFILARAIDRAGKTDGAAIRAALMQTDYTGVMGHFRFTAHRDPASTEGVVVLEMKDGAFHILPKSGS